MGWDEEAVRYRLREAEAAVRVQDEYIRQQTAKLRELETYCRRMAQTQYTPNGAARRAYKTIEQRVEAILGLVVSEEEPL